MTIASTVNLNATTPAPASGRQNVVFADDSGSPTVNISATDPVMIGDSGSGGAAGNVGAPAAGDAAAGKFWKADASWAVPSGSVAFSAITSGSNTSAAMTVGSGSSLEPTGSGVIEANEITGVTISGTPSTGQVLTATSSSAADWQTPGGGGGTFEDELVTMSGTSGSFAHTPTTLYGLFKNGQRLTTLGGSPDFSYTGTSITLTVAATGGDEYEAVYLY